MPLRLLLPQLIATSGMFAIIWLVQIAIYPLFTDLGADAFDHYHTRYMRLVTFVIMPLMLVEAASCTISFFYTRSDWRLIGATAMLAIIWLSTFFLQVPLHQGLTPEKVQTLVDSNWVRTIAWTLRLGLLVVIILRPLERS